MHRMPGPYKTPRELIGSRSAGHGRSIEVLVQVNDLHEAFSCEGISIVLTKRFGLCVAPGGGNTMKSERYIARTSAGSLFALELNYCAPSEPNLHLVFAAFLTMGPVMFGMNCS